MYIKQLSIFAENRNGAILEITQALSAANINMRALSIADTTDFGIVRVIVDKTDEAVAALRDCGMIVVMTDVIAISVDDAPGAFNKVLEAMYDGAIMIEYSYAFVAPIGGGATMILRCREQDKALEILKQRSMRLLSQSEVNC